MLLTSDLQTYLLYYFLHPLTLIQVLEILQAVDLRPTNLPFILFSSSSDLDPVSGDSPGCGLLTCDCNLVLTGVTSLLTHDVGFLVEPIVG